MKEYIDKSALVAEIEKAIDESAPLHDQQCPWEDGYYCGLYKAESIIDTLEVKEVDMEKEINEWQGCEAFPEGVDITPLPKAMEIVEKTAKHFFELGMCAANPLTVKDIEKIYHLVNEVSDDLGVRAMYVNIYQEALKRFKAQKGELI